jgi:hypothetical protein
MPSARGFFESSASDRLMDPACYPHEIRQFLRQEQRILDALEDSVDLLIEVGCMNGRYLDWAVEKAKEYIGVDMIVRHIQAGQRVVVERGLAAETHRFILGDAEEIAQVIKSAQVHIQRERCLILFPFNILGAVSNVERVIDGLRQSQLPFLSSSYQTTNYATACRYEYYRRCGGRDIRVVSDEKGISFLTSDGLSTIAYQPEYLLNLCHAHDLPITAISWSDLNQAYVNETTLANILKSGFVFEAKARLL